MLTEEKHVAGLDRIVCHKDGTISLKFGYFYRFGQTAESVADRVRESVPDVRIIEERDDYKDWPKSSYFVIVIVPA
jgi:hypothetical protein